MKCKEEYVPSEEELIELQITPKDIEGKTLYRGRGCENCNHSGFKGRLALFEIMQLNDAIRELIMEEKSTAVIREECQRNGMRLLRYSGLNSLYEGQTTIDEVVRETIVED